jgi:dienelactone hydrolase
MKRRNWILAGVGFVLAVLAVWQIGAAAGGLEVITVDDAEPRLVVMAPEGAASGSRPLVLIAHGLAGSTAIMRGFALTLAHAGYTAVLWDFEGHGTNPEPLSSSTERGSLQGTAESALAEALARGYGDPERVAILGHSMGSGVALAFGIDHPDSLATIAVSPTGQGVTPELPRNLLLMAGALEGRFVQNAEKLLEEAGRPGGDHATGTARELIVVPGVEHISILFSPTAHAAARDWLEVTFGAQPGAQDYTDRRILWYGLGAVGALLLGAGLAPLVADPEAASAGPRRSVWRRLAALAGGAVGATLILWLVSLAGVEPSQALGCRRCGRCWAG